MSTEEIERQEEGRGQMLSAISTRLVALQKEHYGRGPTQARTYYSGDLVVCLMRGGFNKVEETLLQSGRGDAVIGQRMAYQDAMRDKFCACVEEITGRHVIGFMSGNQQDPDLMAEIFVLEDGEETHDLEAVDEARGVAERNSGRNREGD